MPARYLYLSWLESNQVIGLIEYFYDTRPQSTEMTHVFCAFFRVPSKFPMNGYWMHFILSQMHIIQSITLSALCAHRYIQWTPITRAFLSSLLFFTISLTMRRCTMHNITLWERGEIIEVRKKTHRIRWFIAVIHYSHFVLLLTGLRSFSTKCISLV